MSRYLRPPELTVAALARDLLDYDDDQIRTGLALLEPELTHRLAACASSVPARRVLIALAGARDRQEGGA